MNDVIQGTPEWHALRCGMATASRISDIIAKTKSGPAASRANYMAELIAGRLTGVPAESYSNAAMQWGTEKEPDARAAYEFLTNTEVQEIGFVRHPTIEMSGASPDGIVGTDGLIEIKCPYTSNHIDMLLGQGMPSKYNTQIQWQLACTGRKWCDFVSFDPRMPEAMRLFIKRVPRDNRFIAETETQVAEFLRETHRKVEELTARYAVKVAA